MKIKYSEKTKTISTAVTDNFLSVKVKMLEKDEVIVKICLLRSIIWSKQFNYSDYINYVADKNISFNEDYNKQQFCSDIIEQFSKDYFDDNKAEDFVIGESFVFTVDALRISLEAVKLLK
jgi:hypothetical protein